jgi:hypothetical protein
MVGELVGQADIGADTPLLRGVIVGTAILGVLVVALWRRRRHNPGATR